ncbi:MAG: snoRNA-binding rRNA-processing protein utp10 [Icmadophila ericetorum]|nr:snoRNA-binding rRNA-processing protein utp10 [Icmadophila ericetorum]
MATSSLAAQLAKIAASSTNSLDLKAQKKAHSHSLLFDSRHAATQDFDTIYQICVEGFQELCQIDGRFLAFSRSIFSEQSKREDRTQMTEGQNKELDEVLESFLQLVGARLLLKPAMKAVEWLVRRFRVHEYNTTCLVLTFLPYHSIPLFPTMLSILPQNLPSTFKFLHPYIKSLASPPRHAIVHAASHTPVFYSALNTYILNTSRVGYQHRAILSCWASITTEAVASMLDQSGSGRREIQRQREEDVLLRTLPFLNEGLSMKKVADLRIGCYMILTVLASKAHLEDNVLDAMMEAVTSHWTSDTSHAGLICLSVLAQNKQRPILPYKVYKAVMSIENLEDDLLVLKEQYCIDKLTLGLVLGVLKGLEKERDLFRLKFVRSAIESQLLDHAHTSTAIESILTTANEFDATENQDLDTQGQLADLILRLSESEVIGSTIQDMIKESKIDIDQLENKLQAVIRVTEAPTNVQADIEMEDIEPRKEKESFKLAAKHISTRTANEISFLSQSESYILGSLSEAFLLASKSATDLQTFSNFSVLRKSLALVEPLFFSFLIRMWCGLYSVVARVAAIDCACSFFKLTELTTDVQLLFPYVIYALGDPSSKVRAAATELVLILFRGYKVGRENDKSREWLILGKDNAYGPPSLMGDVHWLPLADTSKFLENILMPVLEECRLDASHIGRWLTDVLNGSSRNKTSKDTPKIKTSFRVTLLIFLSSHIVNSASYSVRIRLLSMLSEVDKVGTTTRTKCLLPLLQAQAQQSAKDFINTCTKENVDETAIAKQLLSIVSATDRDGLRILQTLITPSDSRPPSVLRMAAFQRIRDIWGSMKQDMQLGLVELLLGLALEATPTSSQEGVDVQALDTLRGIMLSANILVSLLNSLPSLSGKADGSPSSKRRRTSHGATPTIIEHIEDEVSLKIRKITAVLELTEASRTGRDVSLLHVLFPLLADVQHGQARLGADLGYIQLLALNSINAVVEHSKSSSTERLDGSGIRADLIVDCLRSNSSPQVQQAALLLMSNLARTVPEVVIHSVMPIFTFMGSTILRQNDDYSAHVIDKTIDSIIPPLMATLRKKGSDTVTSASELLLSFVAAFEHIPVYRRQNLFHSLVEKLGPDDFLFAILAMLLEKYAGDAKVRTFAANLASQYSPTTQLSATLKYLDLVSDTLKSERTISERLLAFDDARRPTSIAANLLSLLPQVLSSQRLITRISKTLTRHDGHADAAVIRQGYSQMLGCLLQLMVDVRQDPILYLACERVLDSLLGLLSMQEFIISLGCLFDQDDVNVRRQGLVALEHRIKNQKIEDSIAQKASLTFLPRLISVIEDSPDLPLRHTAIACLDQIIEKYGKKDVAAVALAVTSICGEFGLGNNEPRVQVLTTLCLATSVEVLREAIIPSIPKIMPQIIKLLQSSIEGNPINYALHNAVYSFLEALITYIPWLVTGDYLDQLLQASQESANANMGSACDQNRLDVLKLLAKQIEPRECFLGLTRTWPNAMAAGPEAIKEHLEVLNLAVEKHSKLTISKYSQIICDIFLGIFDLRRLQLDSRTEDSYTEEEIDQIEEITNQIAIKVIFKLNDTTFRPIFNRLLEWATIPQTPKEKKGIMHRRITWCNFLFVFFDTLKSIVTSYSSFILDPSVAFLTSFDSQSPTSMTLTNITLQTLTACFSNDQDEFFTSPGHFSPIPGPLISLVPHTSDLPHLLECIVSLASATSSSQPNLKVLNTVILAHMRSQSATTRLAAVNVQTSIAQKLGEEWLLGLLSEILPFIAEGLEDEDEGVEAAVRKWVGVVEGVLGEGVGGMLG